MNTRFFFYVLMMVSVSHICLCQTLIPPANPGFETGSFAIFGTVVKDLDNSQAAKNNIFIGVLIPVKDYGKLVEQNPNCTDPDDGGISKIVVSTMILRARSLDSWMPRRFRRKK